VTKTQTRPRSSGTTNARPRFPALTAHALVGMSQGQLDNLFRMSPPGPIPRGVAAGTAIVAAGGPVPAIAAALAPLAWRGKVFDADGKALVNRIGPLGVRAIRATVRMEPSRLDGKPAIVLDYSRTSLLAHYIRDEIREVAPRLYLGIVYWGRRKTVNFALDFAEET
jgi:hypothetical protein